ncbi:MAG: hypothetical protein HUU20_21370 [Pirellulales bacterium]|nr:hypothetical protein [Pirellulales bacterium]
MRRRTTTVVLGTAAAAFAALMVGDWRPSAAVLADPPAGQSYVGTKRCASCHFEQYMTWKKSKHALSFENLPPAYKSNAACLQCHTTGFGQPGGFQDEASTPDLVGNTCENCHGPGSEHCKIAEGFAAKKTLSPEEQKAAKESIWRITPDNGCAKCHMTNAHKAHEQYEKSK